MVFSCFSPISGLDLMSKDEKDPEQEIEEIEIEITQADTNNEKRKKETPIEFYEGTIEYTAFDTEIDYSA